MERSKKKDPKLYMEEMHNGVIER